MSIGKVKIGDCRTYAESPPLPKKTSIEAKSLAMLKAANVGVSFTGVMHLGTGVVYLHPLVGESAGLGFKNKDIGTLHDLQSIPSVGDIDVTHTPNAILHPNLSPAARALAGQLSGHTQICQLHSLSIDECVGFAVHKKQGFCTLSTTSRTCNSTKFKQRLTHGSQAFETKNKKAAALIARFSSVLEDGDGGMSKSFAGLIAATIELAFIVKLLKSSSGNFEAPF